LRMSALAWSENTLWPDCSWELRRFFVGAPHSEQGDDIGLRQRRFGTVVEVEAAIGCAG